MLAAAGLLGTVALTATPAVAAPEATATTCRVNHLPLPQNATGYTTIIAGGDVKGRYAVGSVEIAGRTEQVLWKDGAVSVPPLPFGEGELRDVNSSGVAVGYGLTMNRHVVPVAWSAAGGLRELPVPYEGWAGDAFAINSRGDIVGQVNDPADVDDQLAVRWPADAPGTVEVMAAEGPHYGLGVDEDGTVLAQLGNYVWNPGPAAVWDPDTDEVELLGEGTFATEISGGYVAGSKPGPDGDLQMIFNLNGRDREVRALDTVTTVNRFGDAAGWGPLIERRNGSTLTLESPAGYPFVSVLSDTGIAYGKSAGLPVRWTNCR
ncbi:hypothetical protein JCM9533A_24980 [Catenuloplanes niger JCM 9533]